MSNITTYKAGKNSIGKPVVWMTIPADENCDHDCHYIVQVCRTVQAAERVADKWQKKENKAFKKNNHGKNSA